MVIALVLGAALTFFYLWQRDLVANMIGHFMVDFIANVLPRCFNTRSLFSLCFSVLLPLTSYF